MTEPKHTPEPWMAVKVSARNSRPLRPLFGDGLWHVVPDDGCTLLRMPLAIVDRGDDHDAPTREQAEHDAARIVACVNALAGLNPAELPGLIRAVEGCFEANGIVAVREALSRLKGEEPAPMHVLKRRALGGLNPAAVPALVAALEGLEEWASTVHEAITLGQPTERLPQAVQKARAALAAARGG